MSSLPIPPEPGQPLLPHIDQSPEPSSVVPTNGAPAPPNKRGRPRKYPEGATAAERMRAFRAEKKRLAEIRKTVKHDDTESRGRYLVDADKGKGLIRSGGLNIERIQGWAQINELYGSASVLDELSDEEFVEKLSQAFESDPELVRLIDDWSVSEIREHLRNHIVRQGLKARAEEGHKGRVRPEGTGPGDEPETNPYIRRETVGPRRFKPSREHTRGFDIRISTDVQNRIDDCLLKLRDDQRYVVWIEPTEKVGSDGEMHREGIGHFQCQLCGAELHTPVAMIRDHFVDTHRDELRKFFLEKGCRFNKAYLGIFERSEKRTK